MLIESISKQAWKAIYPPPDFSVSSWAAERRYLSPEASAEPGKWLNRRAPHLMGPMDALSPKNPCKRVVCKFSSQTGKTEITLNYIGYIIDVDPGPTLAIQPNVKPMGEAYSKDRISPLIRDCPTLAEKVAQGRGRDSANTISHKSFPGGHLTIGGANSPAGLASRPIRYFIGDELDRWEITKEGSPLALARKRQTTFNNRKELLTSSPTFDNVGIDAEYRKCESHYEWQLQCPTCGEYQFPQKKHFQWDDDHRKAKYVCEHCGTAHDNKLEEKIKATGKWIKQKDDGVYSTGWWMNQFGSSFAKWIDTLDEFISAKDDKDLLQVVVNTAFCETWKDGGEAMTQASLYDSRERFDLDNLPEDVEWLTAGVDVQKDRLECTVVGWSTNHKPYVLGHQVFFGSPTTKEVWGNLDDFINMPYGGINIMSVCVDRGYLTDHVDTYCRPKWGRVYGTKGIAGQQTNPIGRIIILKVPGKPRTRYVPIGVDKFKDHLQAILAERHAIHFSDSLDEEYFNQLTAEEVVIRKSRGQDIREWIKVRKRNEALDCFILAWAAKEIKYPKRKEKKKNKATTTRKKMLIR